MNMRDGVEVVLLIGVLQSAVAAFLVSGRPEMSTTCAVGNQAPFRRFDGAAYPNGEARVPPRYIRPLTAQSSSRARTRSRLSRRRVPRDEIVAVQIEHALGAADIIGAVSPVAGP